jgi:hypothetical protein
MKNFTAFLTLLLSLSSALAADQPHGSWKDAHVTSIAAYSVGGPAGKGYVVVTFDANGSGTPSCASGYPRDVVIDMSTSGGVFAGALMQSAKLSGMSVTVTGAGTCSVIPTAETLASVESR